jgi:hypothetical protein
MTIEKKNTAEKLVSDRDARDQQLIDERDQLVANAAKGDRRAIAVIALVYNGVLLDGARAALGRTRPFDLVPGLLAFVSGAFMATATTACPAP